MKVTLHQLDIFIEVVKKLSITKAAHALKMTQPGVTIQIKELEKRYGIKLIEIIGKKLYVTDAGKDLYQAYQEINNKFADIESAFSQRLGALKGNFKICIVSTAQYFIPKLLGHFQKKYPLVRIKLTVTNRLMTL
jgi:DNA-binding transcriptional LysR family regulator